MLTLRVLTSASLAVPTFASLARPAIASADSVAGLTPHTLWQAWSWEPGIVLPLFLSAWLYGRGVRSIWRAAGAGRGVRQWQAGAFAAGWFALALALVSPLHPMGEVLFSAHMVQHEILMVVAAPLLVLGRPLVAFLWAVPMGWRRRVGDRRVWGAGAPGGVAWRILTRPLVAVLVQGVVLWGWHLPRAYQASLASDGVHALQHASFLLTALLFWWSVIDHHGDHAHYGVAVLALFGTMMLTGVLGALITFSRTLWYPAYRASPAIWGVTPVEDQQLAGLIMWIPGSVSYLIAALLCLASWLRASEQRAVARFLPPPRA